MYRKKTDDPVCLVVGSKEKKFRRLRSWSMEGGDADDKGGIDTKNAVSGGEATDGEASWADSVWRKVNNYSSRGRRLGREPCTIYKIPGDVRRQNSRVYLPTVVSIGPYHYSYGRREPQFGEMQSYKWRCLGYLLGRGCRHVGAEDSSSRVLLERCLEEMKSLEARAQSCYSRVVEMENNEFAEMLLLDGCFILRLLLERQGEEEEEGGVGREDEPFDEQGEGWRKEKEVDEDDEEGEAPPPKTVRSWAWSKVLYDLLLLENQIPFFVVQKLFRLLKTPKQSNVSLPSLALRLFSNLHPRRNPQFSVTPKLVVHHLLHLFYLSILPSPSGRQPMPATAKEERILSGKQLREVGIRLVRKKDTSSFLDISFSDGAIEIPPLQVYDYSSSLFSNLIAFEQCYPNTQGHVTTYATFMEWLMNDTTKTRGLFHMDAVVVSRLRTEKRKVGDFFDGLCPFVPFSSPATNYLADMFVEVARYRGSRWRRWSAAWSVHHEDGHSWVAMAVLAAVAMLVLSFLQTSVSLRSYLNPPCC